MTPTALPQQIPGVGTVDRRTVGRMTVVTHLLAALGPLAAVALLLLMAAVPLLVDLPLTSAARRAHRRPR